MERTVYGNNVKELFVYHRKNGKTLVWIKEALNISLNVLKEWSVKLSRGESLEDQRNKNGKKKQFSDEELQKYLVQHIDATLEDIGNYFGVSGVAIWQRLKGMGYSHKKKKWYIENEMNENDNNFNKNF